MNKKTNRKSLRIGSVLVHFVCILVCICTVAPFVLVVTSSLTNEDYLTKYGYSFLIKAFDTTAYKYVWANSAVILNA